MHSITSTTLGNFKSLFTVTYGDFDFLKIYEIELQ